jgi:hypothetical protein
MLSQSIAEDIEFNEMSMEAQLMYMRSIPFLDRDGLVNGHPSILFGKIAPLMPDMLPRMKAIIDEWIAAGLVISYADNKTTVLYFKGFTQNQIGMRYEREPESQFAPPPGFIRTKDGLTKSSTPVTPQESTPPTTGNDPSGNLPAIFRQSSGNLPPEEKRREEKRMDARGGGMPADCNPPIAPQPTKPFSKSDRRNGKATHFDQRQTATGGLLPKGTGKTPMEVWRESFAWTPTAAQIREMDENATDLMKWRKVTAECAIKAFRSYTNVMDVYLNGWRDPTEPIPKQKVSGNLGVSLSSI